MEKLKNLLKRIIAAFKALWEGRATPPQPTFTESIVKPVEPAEKPVQATPDPVQVVQYGDIPVSRVTDNFLRSGAGYGKPNIPNETNTPEVNRTGYDLGWTNGNWKLNSHLGTYAYTFTVPTGYTGPVELTWSEAVGTVDGVVTAYIADQTGSQISAIEQASTTHGKVTLTSVSSGLYIFRMAVDAKSPCPLVVQLNHI